MANPARKPGSFPFGFCLLPPPAAWQPAVMADHPEVYARVREEQYAVQPPPSFYSVGAASFFLQGHFLNVHFLNYSSLIFFCVFAFFCFFDAQIR